MGIDAAKAKGAMALFGEKYGDVVRVVEMSAFSIELCGGTHVQRTGEIGFFKLTSEGAVAAGVRRVEAITGETTVAWIHQLQQVLQHSAELLKADKASLVEKTPAITRQIKTH